jgi:hypothetical protein
MCGTDSDVITYVLPFSIGHPRVLKIVHSPVKYEHAWISYTIFVCCKFSNNSVILYFSCVSCMT